MSLRLVSRLASNRLKRRALLIFLGYGVACLSSPAPLWAQNVPIGYRLRLGDRLRINVLSEPDLSGEYEINDSGTILFPLIGAVKAAGLTTNILEATITDMLRDGYLRKPSVRVDLLKSLPIYVLGEVQRPGRYDYVAGLTVLNAIALAGGFGFRARQDSFMITRDENGRRQEIEANQDTEILPGDIIKVLERFLF
jgi:protein involved in polysaccharide export with SLBB domain